MKNAVLISCFDWYDKRLQPIAEVFSRKYRVTILTSDFSHIDKKQIINKNPNCEYLHVPTYKSNISLGRIISHLFFGIRVRKRLVELSPDVVYLLLPPNNIAYHVLKYKKEHAEVRLIVDIIDMWPESMPFSFMGDNIVIKKWKALRENAIKNADGVVVECDYYKEQIKADCPIHTLYVLKKQSYKEIKYFEEHVAEWSKANYQNIENGLIVLGYVGSINNIIDIDEIVRVVRILMRTYRVEINVIGKGESRELFIDSLEKEGVKVNYYGALFDEIAKMKILGRCHYGLNIMKKGLSVGLSIKSIDYFSYGLPIINNINGDTWKMVEMDSLGINILRNGSIENINDTSWLTYRQNVRRVYEERFSVVSIENHIGDILEL